MLNVTYKGSKYSLRKRFSESKLKKQQYVWLVVLIFTQVRSRLETSVFDWFFSNNWIWIALAAYTIGLIQSDLIDENSFLKFAWNKVFVGLSHDIDLALSDDQNGVPDGYERWFLTHEIHNMKNKRCIDSFNTFVSFNTGLLRIGDMPIESFERFAKGQTQKLMDENKKYTFEQNTTCVELKDVKPIPLAEFMLPENSEQKMLYRILDDKFESDFASGPLEIKGEFDVHIDCKSECYGARTKDRLTLKRMHNKLVLIGNPGNFGCAACYGGIKTRR